MPEHCAAYSCTNRRTTESRTRGITFHRFPKDKDWRKKWEVALRRKKFTASGSTVICSDHFKPEDFDRTGQVVRLREGVIPSIFNFPVRVKKLEKGRKPSTSIKDEESRSSAPRDEPQASTSHSQPHDLEMGRTRSASRKAKESRSLAPLDEPEASASHAQPLDLRKERMSRTSRKAEESRCLSSEDESEALPSNSEPQPHVLETGRTTSTSRQGEESQSLAPQDEPQASTSHAQPLDDHGYALPPSPTTLKARLHDALARVESLERERKNAVAREKRAKTTIMGLLGDLREKNLINEELKERLYFYSDLQLDFMAKQGREYTKDFRDFALALHLHGPKAYEYLRQTRNFPLPHPHTLQRWLCSVEDEPGLNDTTQDDASI